MKKENDIVQDIFTRIKAILGDEFNGQIVIELDNTEMKIRQDWGGTAAYIQKKRDIQRKKQLAQEAIKNGKPVKEVIEISGISRSSAYYLLKHR